MAHLRTAVIGAGYFGRFHAEKYARLPGSQLLAIVDADRARAEEVARRHKVRALQHVSELLGSVDAVTVAVPTAAHFEVARECLEAGIHVLIEKPIAATVEEARELVRLARLRGLVLQVGHLVRFEAATMAIAQAIKRPLFIECHRIAPFKPRGTDVNVVLDLMIHDIDLILSLVRSPVASVDAVGAPVITGEPDIANARLRFESGCVANVTASRVSLKSERKVRIFERATYISLDMLERRYAIIRRKPGENLLGLPNYEREEHSYREGDPLEREIEAFLEAVATGTEPLVSGEDGLIALDTALRIGDSLRESARRAGLDLDSPAD
jgi:predicted dehydrogenase